jgi:hypothetical protein
VSNDHAIWAKRTVPSAARTSPRLPASAASDEFREPSPSIGMKAHDVGAPITKAHRDRSGPSLHRRKERRSMTQMTSETGVPARATRREWIGLAVLTLAALVYAMDLTVLNHKETRTETEHEEAGLFILIGAIPRTDWLPTAIARDEKGYVLTGDDVPSAGGTESKLLALETTAPGIFAAGACATAPSNESPPRSVRALRPSRKSSGTWRAFPAGRGSSRHRRDGSRRSSSDDQRWVGPKPVSLPSASRYVTFRTPFS